MSSLVLPSIPLSTHHTDFLHSLLDVPQKGVVNKLKGRGERKTGTDMFNVISLYEAAYLLFVVLCT
jgi:hypothetical protein